MSRDEVVENIGTIARSGTREFLGALRERAGQGVPPELIGQFGVGFYSSFMVADRVMVVTPARRRGRRRRAGSRRRRRTPSRRPSATSRGARPSRCTSSPTTTSDGLADFAETCACSREIVKKYSDFVAYPIRLEDRDAQLDEADLDARPRTRSPRRSTRVLQAHLARLERSARRTSRIHVEGSVESRRCSTSRRKAPFDLCHASSGSGRAALRASACSSWTDCEDLLPAVAALRARRRRVATTSRSTSRARCCSRTARSRPIRRHLVRSVLGALKEMKDERPETYQTFWNEFGAVLKEGMLALRRRPGADPRARARCRRRHGAGRAHDARRVRRAHEGGAAARSTT